MLRLPSANAAFVTHRRHQEKFCIFYGISLAQGCLGKIYEADIWQ